MEQHTEEPRVCQEPEVLKTSRPDPAESPPPNCAICLGTCTNKCFTDCCLHQFCFSCLLEWSKIKAECPLCKQPFKSIIYNIKSNLEYEEHIITNPERENQEDLLTLSDPSEYLFLPNGPRPQRHFQYRTTFTLEPGGEFAIQQLLLSHPRTNSISLPADRYPYIRFNSSSTHSVDQRRTIYIENWWVEPQSDVTGRFRVCTPHFFRENPAQAHHIIPWLNRELTALINHTLIYPVQQEILDMLCVYPILSTQFRSHIVQHLGARTDHFIHEFYNFVRSPYDMIGYDRHATYRHNRPPPVYNLSDEDSDVHVVDSPENDDCVFVPNRTPEVILIDSESSGNDSDVIMRTPTPPPIVDLVNDTTTEDEQTETPQSPQQQQQHQQQQQQLDHQNQQRQEPTVESDRIEARSPQLPIKIRLKRSKSSAEICKNYKHKEKRRLKRSHSSSSASSENDSSSTESYKSSSKSSSSDYYEYVMKKKKSKLSNKKHSKSDSKYLSKNSKYRKKQKSETKTKKSKRNSGGSSKKSKKQKKSKRRDSEKRHKNIKIEKSDTSTSSASYKSDVASSDDDNYHRRKKPKLFYEIKTEGSSTTSVEPQHSQTDTSQYDLAIPDNYNEAAVVSSSSATTLTSPTAVATFPSSTETSLSPAVTAASTFSSTNLETNSDHWSTTSIASSCPSSILPQDLGVAGPSNCVSVQSMVVVKDKDGSLWCRSNYQPSKRFGLYRPDLNRSSDNSSDSD